MLTCAADEGQGPDLNRAMIIVLLVTAAVGDCHGFIIRQQIRADLPAIPRRAKGKV
jgi:hypothetical protein